MLVRGTAHARPRVQTFHPLVFHAHTDALNADAKALLSGHTRYLELSEDTLEKCFLQVICKEVKWSQVISKNSSNRLVTSPLSTAIEDSIVLLGKVTVSLLSFSHLCVEVKKK